MFILCVAKLSYFLMLFHIGLPAVILFSYSQMSLFSSPISQDYLLVVPSNDLPHIQNLSLLLYPSLMLTTFHHKQ